MARELARPVAELTEQDTVGHAVEQLRQRRASLAVVRDDTGRLTGMVALDDLLARLLHP
ncbi:CBS domain-containing protein [Streptomyces sp. NPDC056708]|uniref:CBS domain-containing protein n=1 Tax=unclassified Streptomyces TaxID=2593676 RepID=UPI003697AD52